ncbi:MAG: sodium ion-translocating decarboxylase subunit beta [Bacilli bacterium]|nr:sodium ion-translocating decarboxylase subunit beta [Bacilli bacterium]
MGQIWETIKQFCLESGIAGFFADGGWKNLIMMALACVLLFLAIKKKFEPYLLLPIAFGMLLVNIPKAGAELFKTEVDLEGVTHYSGLLGYLYYGVKWGIYPCLIFLCIGATTDFGPLIANKKTMLLGAAAQIGIFITFIGAIALGKNGLGWTNWGPEVASSIGIIGGADGPTAILVTSKLAPEYLGSIAIVAYSYMALVPVIQPPIIRLLTTKKERMIKMEQTRPVSKREKILFPIIVATVVILIVPSCAPLIGCLMLGNLIKESGVVPKITETLSNSLMYIITIILGVCVGATARAETFLTTDTLFIFALGIIAFSIATACGVLAGKVMCVATRGKVNPMIGAAGVSAVPMAARVVQKEGQKEDPSNFLLMHAMGPNVAGVIGSAVAAGVLLLLFAA